MSKKVINAIAASAVVLLGGVLGFAGFRSAHLTLGPSFSEAAGQRDKDLYAFQVQAKKAIVVEGGDPCVSGKSASVYDLHQMTITELRCGSLLKQLPIYKIEAVRHLTEDNAYSLALATTAWERVTRPTLSQNIPLHKQIDGHFDQLIQIAEGHSHQKARQANLSSGM